jgi:hypothetical protein
MDEWVRHTEQFSMDDAAILSFLRWKVVRTLSLRTPDRYNLPPLARENSKHGE